MSDRPTYEELEQRVRELEAASSEESARRLSLALRAGNLAVWDWDLQTNRMVWDDEMLGMYGITRDEFTGTVEDWKGALHPEDRDRAIAECESALAGTTDFDTWFRIIKPDGAVRFITAEGRVVRDEEGSPVRMLGVNRDITTERKAQSDYQTLFREMLSGFALHEIITDDGGEPVDYRFLQVNPAWERVTGISAADAIGKTVRELLPGIEAHWIETFGRVALTGVPMVFEQHSGDFEAFFEVTAFCPAPGQFACIFQDITDRRHALEANRVNSKRLQSALAMQELWSSSETELANFALQECLEITGSEFGFLGLMDDSEATMTMHGWSNSVMGECSVVDQPLVFEVEECGLWTDAVKHRAPIIVNDYAAPHPSKRGTPDGHIPIRRYLGLPVVDNDRIVAVAGLANKSMPFAEHDAHNASLFLRDFWHQLQIRRERDQLDRIEALMQRAQHMESLGVLAGGIAHDFNNMLGAIVGYAELTLETSEPGSTARSHMERLLTAAGRASEMVQQILAFSRKAEGQKTAFDFGGLLEETVALLTGMLPSTIDLCFSIDPDAPSIIADATQVQQIIMNLCTNALHAMPDGGQLSLALSRERITENNGPEVVEVVPGDYAKLTVRDTGIGIPADILDRVFEPFFTTKELGKGSGMGLAMSHGIVMNHKGFITVESELGGGTVFDVYFPASELAAEVWEVRGAGVQAGKEKIVLVDDESVVRDMTAEMLRNLGYRVTAFADSTRAVAAIEEAIDDWDAVITDQTMPRMDGVELLRRVRELREDLPVIIMTGHSEKLESRSDGGVGADSVLMKPFRLAELSATLRRVLERGVESTD